MHRLMPELVGCLALTLGAVAGCASTATGGGSAAEVTDRALASYGVGWNLGRETREGIELDGLNADFGLLRRGFADGVSGAESAYDEQAINDVLALVQAKMAREAVAQLLEDDPEFQRLHDANIAQSTALIDAFGRQDGVQTLDSGVHYLVLRTGTGARGSGATSIVFDFKARGLEHEIAAGEGVERHVADMLPATADVIAHMRVGDHWQVAIPPDLAFGPAGDPPYVGPNEAIFAEIRLREVRP
jgi:FKBP-type peptidyl-prolyl cis-trans isomerase FklB